MKKIAIHSVPRSGSSWLGQILNSSSEVNFKYQPLFSYAFKDFLNESSSKEKIHVFFEDISKSNDAFLNQDDQILKGSYPKFNKSSSSSFTIYKEVRYHFILENLLKKDTEVKVIGLIRNPLAVIHSWWKAPKEFRQDLGWDILEEWKYAPKKNNNKREEYNGFSKWKEVTLLFLELKQKYPDRFYLLEYKDLLATPIITTKNLFSFCGIPFDKSTEDFLIDSTTDAEENLDAYSVYRKTNAIDDKWKLALPAPIIDSVISDLSNTPLEKFLL